MRKIMKNYNLVLKIPIELNETNSEDEFDDFEDIKELYNTHKHILLDLIENMIINDNQEYEVTIEKIKKEKS